MSETNTRFPNQIWACLRSPGRGFESIGEKDLKKGVVVILLVAALSAYAGYNYTSKTPFQSSASISIQSMPTQTINTDALRTNFIIFTTLGNFITVFTGWLLIGVILHIIARLMTGEGGLKRLLAQMGFASPPLILQQLLRLIDAYTISPETLLDVSASLTLGGSLVMRFMSRAMTTFTLFGIWTLILTIMAVSVNYQSPRTKSAIATIVAHLVVIVVRLFLPI
jgi:hypothetical protein